MKFLKKKVFIFIFLASILLAVFVSGAFVGRSLVECKICPPEEIDFSLFWEAYHELQNKFPDKEKIDVQKIIYGAISGMVKSLEDPYTVFLPPEETKRFQEDVQGSFEGVGMEIDVKKGQLIVV